MSVLNLFGYTGAATCAAAAAGAAVCHVDAAEGMVKWCKENAALCGLADAPIRYIADDCLKFVRREVKRGRRYDAVIMDPPTFGRGSTGELWRLEDHLWDLLTECRALLSGKPLFFLINAYTARLSPTVVANLLGQLLAGARGDHRRRGRPAGPAGRQGAPLRDLRRWAAAGSAAPILPMPSLADTYYERRAGALLERARESNAPVIARLSPIIGQSIAQGGVVHTFGSGHSELISREIIGRAGGLVCVTGIIDPTGRVHREPAGLRREAGRALRPAVPARSRGDRHRRLKLGQERARP